jgi:capsular exopolysaccharide synthesis family protein
MARSGTKTILVDADMRRPSQHKVFEYSNEVGLSSVLVGEATEEQALQPTEVEGLLLLPSGPHSPNAAELLSSPRMERLIEELSTLADAVVLDSPPLLAVADASILASLVTGTVLVSHVGKTRLSALAQAVDTVNKAGGNLLAVVLNRLILGRGGYYGSYYGYYNYHYYHYSNYGEDEEAPHSHGGGRRSSHRLALLQRQRTMRPAGPVRRMAMRRCCFLLLGLALLLGGCAAPDPLAAACPAGVVVVGSADAAMLDRLGPVWYYSYGFEGDAIPGHTRVLLIRPGYDDDALRQAMRRQRGACGSWAMSPMILFRTICRRRPTRLSTAVLPVRRASGIPHVIWFRRGLPIATRLGRRNSAPPTLTSSARRRR